MNSGTQQGNFSKIQLAFFFFDPKRNIIIPPKTKLFVLTSLVMNVRGDSSSFSLAIKSEYLPSFHVFHHVFR